MIRLLTIASLVAAFLTPAAFGQSTDPASPAPVNPGGMQPETRQSAPGVPAPRQTNQPDRAFIRAATVGGLAEVALAKLAAQKATSHTVKEFAERMVRDHGAANNSLASLVKAYGIVPPDTPDEEHKAMHTRLEQSSGMQFDYAYMQGQIIDHQKTAQLLEYEIGSGENEGLKGLASSLLPVVLDHLRIARGIAAAEPQQAADAPRDRENEKH